MLPLTVPIKSLWLRDDSTCVSQYIAFLGNAIYWWRTSDFFCWKFPQFWRFLLPTFRKDKLDTIHTHTLNILHYTFNVFYKICIHYLFIMFLHLYKSLVCSDWSPHLFISSLKHTRDGSVIFPAHILVFAMENHVVTWRFDIYNQRLSSEVLMNIPWNQIKL